MRISKLGLFGAAILLIVPGCHKRPGQLTPVPGQNLAVVGEPEPAPTPTPTPAPEPIPEIPKIKPENVPMGGGPTSSSWNPADMIADRSALAAQTVYFDFDSSVVKGAEQSKVAAVASLLNKDASAKLLIEGHCDERGTEEYNRALGERRALALREALAGMGLDPMRIRSLSFGEDKPADPGHNEGAWRKNRRGEFVLMHPKK